MASLDNSITPLHSLFTPSSIQNHINIDVVDIYIAHVQRQKYNECITLFRIKFNIHETDTEIEYVCVPKWRETSKYKIDPIGFVDCNNNLSKRRVSILSKLNDVLY